jgi:hypothetical protein
VNEEVVGGTGSKLENGLSLHVEAGNELLTDLVGNTFNVRVGVWSVVT